MKPIRVRARRATPEVMAELEAKGMLRRVQAPEHARRVGQEDQVVERIEAAAEGTGPWQMLVVACNRTRLQRLAAHSDIESWLFIADPASKPLLYVVAACSTETFQRKVAEGRLTADDLVVLDLRPNDPATSFFTVPAGVLHEELTYPGPGPAPVFYVPEPSVMSHTQVGLDGYEITIDPP